MNEQVELNALDEFNKRWKKAELLFESADRDQALMWFKHGYACGAYGTGEQIAALQAALQAELQREREKSAELYAALDAGVKGIFPPLPDYPDDKPLRTSTANYRAMKAVRDKFKQKGEKDE